MSFLRPAYRLVALAAGLLVGCHDGKYAVEVAFGDGGVNPDGAAAIDLLVLDSCPAEADVASGAMPIDGVVQDVRLDRSQSPLAELDPVPAGDYGLYARAVDASCTTVATGCVPVHLEGGGSGTLSVALAASAALGACAATDVCMNGQCIPTGDKVATRVGAGRAHSCALFTNSEIWCWGDNAFGQLGVGDTTPHDGPVKVAGNVGWQKLSVGWDHTCAIDIANHLYCWGRADDGRLGHDQGATYAPAQVGTREDWQVVSASARTTCGRAGEDPYCWGANEVGQLGVGDTNPRAAPADVDTNHFLEFSISAGGTDTTGHMALIRYETVSLVIIPLGRRFDVNSAGAGLAGGDRNSPGPLYLNVSDSTFVSSGGEHVCFLSNSRIYCGGVNTQHQLGRDDTDYPQQVGGDSDWTQIASGTRHTCGRRGTTVWCWGDNGSGQTGATENPTLAPTQVGALDNWTWISAGVNHSCGVRAGLVYCWGANDANQSGLGVGVAGQTSPVAFVMFPSS